MRDFPIDVFSKVGQILRQRLGSEPAIKFDPINTDMTSIFNFQFGEFTSASPDWFSWFSLLISVLTSVFSVWGGFWIANRIYSREREDRRQEENEIQQSEVDLFRNSLTLLIDGINAQIQGLGKYIIERNFSIEINQGVQVQFLIFVDVKYLYKHVGVENHGEVEKINALLATLYPLHDFRSSLKEELRASIQKYTIHESKFYLYRKLLYTKYFEYSNRRSTDIQVQDGIQKANFHPADAFMSGYSELRISISKDKDVMEDNALKDRRLLVEKFVVPLIQHSAQFIPEDFDAIELTDLANDVYAAFRDMEEVIDVHTKAITSFLNVLKTARENIAGYLSK